MVTTLRGNAGELRGFCRAIAAIGAGMVNTTWKYGTGSTRIESPEGNGAAEAFVKTFKGARLAS